MTQFEGDSEKPRLLGEGWLAVPSEDIGVLQAQASKHLRLQSEMQTVILDNTKNSNALIDDVADAVAKLGPPQSLSEVAITVGSLGILLYLKRRRKRKTREVIRIVLKKIFDPTLDWYVMDYRDLKETCDYVGGKDFFGPEDHRCMYTAVIQKLKGGPIRERCVALGFVDYVNEKIRDIAANFVEFKQNEL